jgi:hypothetical protein
MKLFIATTGTTGVFGSFPWFYRTWRQETSSPFRRCERAVAVRIPLTRRALVAGAWQGRLADEDEAYASIGFHTTPYKQERKVYASEPTPRMNPWTKETHVR